ncbi:hypothetical protein [Bacillus sp. Marseille-P3661]|uniref:hypothetical protein n=1 Tax=Bacillus sp. Marseille-P3661 TaxID=1936234 RepID=UPI000C828E7B|nr:hypothetical protein [Bacillus sp. Marseille-P3661]
MKNFSVDIYFKGNKYNVTLAQVLMLKRMIDQNSIIYRIQIEKQQDIRSIHALHKKGFITVTGKFNEWKAKVTPDGEEFFKVAYKLMIKTSKDRGYEGIERFISTSAS